MTPAMILAIAAGVLSLGAFALHFIPKWTIAGKILTWLEAHGNDIEGLIKAFTASQGK